MISLNQDTMMIMKVVTLTGRIKPPAWKGAQDRAIEGHTPPSPNPRVKTSDPDEGGGGGER